MADRGRYHRDECSPSIPVAELLAANKRIRRVEPEPQLPLDRRLPPRPPRDPIGQAEPIAAAPAGRRHAPLVFAAGAAAAVLAGALVANATIDAAGPGTIAAGAASEHITGAEVFRPDVIGAALDGGRTVAVPSPDGDAGAAGVGAPGVEAPGVGAPGVEGPGVEGPGAGVAGSGVADEAVAGAAGAGEVPPGGGDAGQPPGTGMPQDAPSAGSASVATTPATTTSAAPQTTSGTAGTSEPGLAVPITDPVLSVIVRFYAAATSDPAAAYAMLAPSVRDGDAADFARSWAGVVAADVVQATPAGTNAMVVQVVLLRDDGSRLRLTQRIVVGNGGKKIVEAELLSVSVG